MVLADQEPTKPAAWDSGLMVYLENEQGGYLSLVTRLLYFHLLLNKKKKKEKHTLCAAIHEGHVWTVDGIIWDKD